MTSEGAKPQATGAGRSPVATMIVAGLVGFVLRLLGARGDWWLDEIWAYHDAQHLRAWWEALTVLKVDSNHPLNTMVQWCCGPTRAGSVVAGVASIGFAGVWSNRQTAGVESNGLRARVTMWVFALATPMVIWGSEARGYGTAMFSVLLALVSLDRATCPNVPTRTLSRVAWGAAYGVALVLGMLSHLAFLTFVLTSGIWGVIVITRRAALKSNGTRDWQRMATCYVLLHAAPLLFAVAYWVGFVSQLRYTGGPDMPVSTMLSQTAALVVGWPLRDVPWIVTLGGVVLLCGGALVSRYRRGRIDDVVLYVVGIFISPVVMIVARAVTSDAPLHVYPRYFVISATLTLLLISEWIADGLRRGRRGRVLVTSVGIALLTTHLIGDFYFVRDGRGQYNAAVRAMLKARHSSEKVTVLGDHDLRTRMVVDWQARSLAGPGSMVYLPGFDPGAPPDFLIYNLFDPGEAAPRQQNVFGVDYLLTGVFKHYGMSGLTWAVYGREPGQ